MQAIRRNEFLEVLFEAAGSTVHSQPQQQRVDADWQCQIDHPRQYRKRHQARTDAVVDEVRLSTCMAITEVNPTTDVGTMTSTLAAYLAFTFAVYGSQAS
ncbi:hypothetical protein D3C72_2019330 [compost metagenome]